MLSRLPNTGNEKIVGRDNELKLLDQIWKEDKFHIISLVGWGGVGKSFLVNHWLMRMQKDNYRGAQRIYGWSFFSQGAKEGKEAEQTSADEFINHSLKWFGDPNPAQGNPWEKGVRLASLISRQRTLLILDGTEPLQAPSGEMRDVGLKTLIRELAHKNSGLCIITTRIRIKDIEHLEAEISAKEPLKSEYENRLCLRLDLENLSAEAGAKLLENLGVKGRHDELIRAAAEYKGHALALTLLGKFLKTVHDGDIRKRDLIPQLAAEPEQGNHAMRMMAFYEQWLKDKPELNILYLMGIFDRPAAGEAIAALTKEPVIEGLTDKIQPIANEKWRYALKELRELRLLAKKDEQDPDTLDCHPLIREYFGAKLKQAKPDAWKQAHSRLYDFYKNLPKKKYPDTLEEMEPLFAAVAHGCKAGRHQEAAEDVLLERIRRKKEGYSVHKLGAFGSDLAAVSNFFDVLWTKPADGLIYPAKAYILNGAGFDLRALGRLREAAQPMQATLELVIKQEDWKNAAIDSSNLSELWLTIGNVVQAVSYARQSVKFADKSGDGFWKYANRTTLADALHHANGIAESQRLFEEAEIMQKQEQPEYLYLYSLWGFRYCDLLLSQRKYREVLERFEKFLQWRLPSDPLLEIALVNLSAGKAYLLQTQEQKSNDFTQAEKYLNQAVEGLIKAGVQEFIIRGYLARAALYRLKNEFSKAHADLDEVFEIAGRSGMRLYLTDYHLESARLFLAENKPDKAKGHLASAKKLIAETGYHRRDKELNELLNRQ